MNTAHCQLIKQEQVYLRGYRAGRKEAFGQIPEVMPEYRLRFAKIYQRGHRAGYKEVNECSTDTMPKSIHIGNVHIIISKDAGVQVTVE